MSRRLTNLLLLLFLAVAFVTGWIAFGVGTGFVRLPIVLHAVAGLAIFVLVPWKSIIVKSGLKRHSSSAATSLALLGVVSAALISGLLFSVAGVRSYGPLTAIQIHVGAAVAAIALAIVHTIQRPVRPARMDLGRRNLLRAGGVLGVAGASYVFVSGATSLLNLPGRQRRATGSYERGSNNPLAMPVTSWLNDRAPAVPSDWRLLVDSSSRQISYDLAELEAFADELTATLDCTGGWYSKQEWGGVRLDRLVEPTAGQSIVVKSATGYQRRFPISDAEDLLLATRVGGSALSRGHGHPARLVAPGRRGFWWVKWVEEIVIDDRPWWWQSPFPLT